MKSLDITKKYDLSQLNNEQLQAVLDWLKENDTGWDTCHVDKLKSIFCILYNYYGEWKLQTSKGNEINALELFEEELKTYQITEYSTGDFGDLGIKQGTIKATNKDQAWLFHKESNGLQEQEKGFFSFVEVEEDPNCCEIVVNSMGQVEPKYPNYSCDKSDVYEIAHDLIEKGKQHGLKIVVTFEKL